jgi:hypothetical protein
MPDDLPLRQRPGLPDSGKPPPLPTEEEEIRAVNTREELLLRARGIVRRIQERVWRAMGHEPPQGPHKPGG